MHKLSRIMKITIQHDNEIQMWCDELIKQFKMNLSKVFDKLYMAKYTIDDAQNLQELIDHIQAVIQYEKSVMLNEKNQLIFIWKDLDLQLCQNVKIFRSSTTVIKFIQILNNMKQIWYDLYQFQSKKLKQILTKLFYNSHSYY